MEPEETTKEAIVHKANKRHMGRRRQDCGSNSKGFGERGMTEYEIKKLPT